MNKAILVGRVTKDPELKKTPSGNSVVNFSLAINRTFTNQNGEREADFVNCVVWGKSAENMATYVSKGSLIGVDGRIQTRNYEDNNGNRVYVTEVVAESVQFLDTRNNNSNQSTNNNSNNFKPNNTNNNFNQNQTNNSNSDVDFFGDLGGNQNNSNSNDILGGLDISDDELPF